MNSQMQILCFGCLAFLMFVLSATFISRKHPKIGLFFGGLELLSSVFATAPWMYDLKISGKGDWFLMGILGYPPIGLIFWSMFVVGIWCAAVSTKNLRKQNIPTTIAKA